MSVERSLCKAVLLRPGEVDKTRGSVWARDDLSLCWVQSRLWRMCVERAKYVEWSRLWVDLWVVVFCWRDSRGESCRALVRT